jgi:predicted kinase
MKTLVIMRGIPGAGKSTVSNILSEDNYYPVFSADDFFTAEDGTYNFDANKLHDAHKQCFSNTEYALNFGAKKVFVANTFTTEKEIKPYKELAEKYNYRFVSLIVENRHGNESIHNVPSETIDKMINRFTLKLK